MSPILTRPIREQLEHDRIIRQLQARYKRKHDVAINPGPEQNQSVQVGDLAVYPDLVLFAQGGKRLEGTVEVETGESVNQLEALAEWGVFSKLKAPFHLYVPPQSIESARRICDEHQFPVAEIWTYHLSLDQVRFTQVYRSPNAPKIPAAASTPVVEKAAPAKPSTKAAKPTPVKAAAAKAATAKAANGKVSNGKVPHGKPANGKGANGRPLPAKAAAKPSKPAAKPPAAKTKTAKPVAKAAKPVKAATPAKAKGKPAAKKRR